MSDENKSFDLATFIETKDVIKDKTGRLRLNKRGQIEVLSMVLEGKTNRQICDKLGMKPLDFYSLVSANKDFKQAVDFMREEGAEYLADMLLEVPKAMPHSEAKILSDNIKWILSKRHKSRYGDSVSINVEGQISIKGALEDARSRVKDIIEVETINAESEANDNKDLDNDT